MSLMQSPRSASQRLALSLAGALLCTLAGAPAAAQTAPAASVPERMVTSIVSAVVAEIKIRRDELRGARAVEAGIDITTRLIAAHVDFEELARRATGPVWASATATQRAAIVTQFRRLLVHVNAKLLAGYNDEILTVAPLTIAADAIAAEVRVDLTVTRNTGDEPPLPMFVSLARAASAGLRVNDDEQWRIVDARAEGISLVKLYAGNFAAVLARGDGLDHLIKLLTERNNLNAQQLTPRH